MIRTFFSRHAASALQAGIVLALVLVALAINPDLAPVAGFGGLIVNQGNLTMLFQGFKTAFKGGVGQHKPQWGRIATKVTSTTSEEKYGWLGKIPSVREWLGDRVVHSLMQHDYAIKNKDYELTIGVDRNAIDDDQYGVYTPVFTEFGQSVAAHPDLLSFSLLKAGFAGSKGLAYDGQYFFDTDHPVLDENGVAQSVANTDGGSGTNWFLIDSSRAIKPIIYQERQAFNFVRKDQPTDDNVFDRKEFKYGTDGRCNVGFGLWQFAWGSKQTLNATNYGAARSALSGMKGDHGRPIGVMPNLLIVPPSLESAGRKLLNSEYAAGGETNEWKGTAELLVVPWLA